MEVEEREGSSSKSMEHHCNETISQEEQWSNNEDDDDFGDFGDFEEVKDNWDCAPPPTTSAPLPTSSSNTTLSVQDIIHSIEPKVISVITSIFEQLPDDLGVNKELESVSTCFDDPIWTHLQSTNESPSLNFTWNNSKANTSLMSSLRIDARNISRTLPSFMDTSTQLLEPTKVEANASTNNKNSSEEDQTVLPVEFDWKDSCLTDPLENNQDPSSKVNKNEKTVSIIDSFPLLNFMQSSTLIFLSMDVILNYDSH
ncbi:unnamed protein product [Lepeophtheirus salmonis]|uniref:(salmon louse) hypothetical protein n=1 Tax=Lepeophtheirus salmonis TaxID=72036 RepID=A0A7R8CXR2_LEPSM|nr:unnamed protein product [Lepeophtheirus salmonis]CAF2961747.1 unnamed protein product [Lepeophtheirus salmonis]